MRLRLAGPVVDQEYFASEVLPRLGDGSVVWVVLDVAAPASAVLPTQSVRRA